jgi:ceramide glucosyltransferase
MNLPQLYVILLAGAAFSLLSYLVGVWASWRHTAQPLLVENDDELPALTLIKPIKGCEEELEENLRSFFEQRYPAPWQIIFSSTDPDDPGMDLARKVASQYPQVESVFTLADPTFGLNPKVANMQGALVRARYDTVLQTDANVRIKPGFLVRLAGEFIAERASLLSCPVAGVGERNANAALENLHLTAFIAPAVCFALRVANTACVICKTMLFRRSELEEIGGFSLVKDILSEDHILGKAYIKAGKKVVISPLVIDNVNIRSPLKSFFKRHARWLKMTAVISKPGFVAYPLTNPLLFTLLAWIASGFIPTILYIIGALLIFKTGCDAYLVKRMRGYPLSPRYYWLSPLRDLLVMAIWVYASVSRNTEWRGKRFHIGANTKIYPI